MADINDVYDALIDRILSADDSVEGMTPGSKERVMEVTNIAKLVDAVQKLESVRIDEEDKIGKREEQKRMNDEELKFKAIQAQQEAERLDNEMYNRKKQRDLDILGICVNGVTNGLALFGQQYYTSRIMRHEYQISGGSSLIGPKDLMNAAGQFGKMVKK